MQADSFDGGFSESDLKVLRSIKDGKKGDTTYIREMLNIMYREEEEKIQFRCLSGCREGIVRRNNKEFFREKKEAITPEKRLIINKMFRNRIYDLPITMDQKISRIGQHYINRMVKSAFSTLQESYASMVDNIENHVNANENDEE